MSNSHRKLKTKLFESYSTTLLIVLFTIILSIIIYAVTHKWAFIPSLLSISMPLFILFFKTEHDTKESKNEKVLISRNILLAYLIKLSDISNSFSKYKYKSSIPNIYDLSKKIDCYDDINKNIKDINLILSTSEDNFITMENRLAVHKDLKQVLFDMLDRTDIIYTENEYEIFAQIQFACTWLNAIHTNTSMIKTSISDFKTNCGAYINDTPLRFEGGEEVIPPKWEEFKNSVIYMEERIELDKLLQNSVIRLIGTLNIYKPNLLNNK